MELSLSVGYAKKAKKSLHIQKKEITESQILLNLLRTFIQFRHKNSPQWRLFIHGFSSITSSSLTVYISERTIYIFSSEVAS